MLQHLGNSALWTLLDIFNLSWRQGKVSQCWKEAIRTFHPHCPSTSTLALLLYRYNLIQLYILPLMPYRRSFNRSSSFHTLSNVFCRSTLYERSNTRASKRCTYSHLCRRSCTLVHRIICSYSKQKNANCFMFPCDRFCTGTTRKSWSRICFYIKCIC
jgi:hypothetical protein